MLELSKQKVNQEKKVLALINCKMSAFKIAVTVNNTMYTKPVLKLSVNVMLVI